MAANTVCPSKGFIRWAEAPDFSIRSRVVESAGYKAETFASARQFLDWLRTGQAACLVLDVQMDGMSGFDLQERLAVPVIFITSHDDATTRERIEKSGAAAHLTKPFDGQTILKAIRRAVGANHDTAH